MTREQSKTPEQAMAFHHKDRGAAILAEKRASRSSENLRDAMFREAKASSERRAVARKFANVSNPLEIIRSKPVRRAKVKIKNRTAIPAPIDPSLPCSRCGANPRYGCEHLEAVQ